MTIKVSSYAVLVAAAVVSLGWGLHRIGAERIGGFFSAVSKAPGQFTSGLSPTAGWFLAVLVAFFALVATVHVGILTVRFFRDGGR